MSTRHHSSAKRGVVVSLAASVLFGLMFYISGALDASAEFIFGWRIVITLACFLIALASPGGRRALRALMRLLREMPRRLIVIVAASLIVGVQMWLFSWSPLHGHGLDASLGYLLLPISLVIVGRVVFGESVSRVQWIAVAIAIVAVSISLVATAALSWVTLVICLGYPVYFALRKHHHLASQAAFGVEVALMSPVALWFALATDGAATLGGAALVAFVGLAGAAAMWAYLGVMSRDVVA
ncbi:EamA family transporter RarD [Cumulibacter soli]|uniref:EamA family transporter RarD n=1 Tax=Cumulibacter soli TaxID=2546344 RepID=UPI0010680DE0|nr:EamA family transporter RarD [Cumulibacter soli]